MKPKDGEARTVRRRGTGGQRDKGWHRFGPDAVLAIDSFLPLARLARRANAGEDTAVSLALPIDPRIEPDHAAPALPDEPATLLFVEITAAAAFALVSAMPLRGSAREVLAECGLTLVDLSLRETRANSSRG